MQPFLYLSCNNLFGDAVVNQIKLFGFDISAFYSLRSIACEIMIVEFCSVCSGFGSHRSSKFLHCSNHVLIVLLCLGLSYMFCTKLFGNSQKFCVNRSEIRPAVITWSNGTVRFSARNIKTYLITVFANLRSTVRRAWCERQCQNKGTRNDCN